ncbi:phosphodiester glycosidase family protein [Ovoidimarina sediminis]|uniref:phosphodiester glycosidase family protein n=1 Tax=Ovoidimarina sediminis TaxID=3079856 RepID=UPI0029122F3E|nr:phosphodiester glycosidase family protein [Rhodophyticola sp. MJ-SS7]MDU8943826.1 phosphodiester glycosidase family protein [Rhodophyticola sp. MJ-SS7]
MSTALRMLAAWAALCSALSGGGAAAGGTSCGAGTFEDVPFSYCEVTPADGTLRVWHTAPDGLIFGTFERLRSALQSSGETLLFAMNGAMYHEDRAPVGLYIEDGTEHVPLVTRDGPGNFGLLPNGVFCVTASDVRVIETLRFAKERPDCRFATQSGPMLVIDGALHPRFLADGTSRNIRNGVGVRPDGTAVFVISDAPVNFHRFARLFRDAMGTPNALYIDGKVSRLYAPALGRRDIGFPLGPIVGAVSPAQ